MIDCSALLAEFSEFRDGLMEPSRASAVEAHLRICPSCQRYARVVNEGVGEYRAASSVEPSEDFLVRLQERLQLVDLESEIYGRSDSSLTSAGVVVLLALILGASAWIPVLRSSSAVVRLPPVAAHAPGYDVKYAFFRRPTLVVPASPYAQGSQVIFRTTSLNTIAPQAAHAAISR